MEMNNFTAEIFIVPRKDILNPESTAIKTTLDNLGYKSITKIEAGKYLTLELQAKSKIEAEEVLKKACNEFIANPVIEDYVIKVR